MIGLPSVFKQNNVFNAKILEKHIAKSWSSQSLLLRMINQQQQEILLIATDKAKESLMEIEGLYVKLCHVPTPRVQISIADFLLCMNGSSVRSVPSSSWSL